jgi:hypothetical protein
MASSSSNLANPLYTGVISERLTKANHVTWKAQVLAVLRGAHLVGHITETVKPPPQEINGKEKDERVSNLTYEEWYASDQQVLGFLFSCSPPYQRRSCHRLQPKTPWQMHERRLKACSRRIREHSRSTPGPACNHSKM